MTRRKREPWDPSPCRRPGATPGAPPGLGQAPSRRGSTGTGFPPAVCTVPGGGGRRVPGSACGHTSLGRRPVTGRPRESGVTPARKDNRTWMSGRRGGRSHAGWGQTHGRASHGLAFPGRRSGCRKPRPAPGPAWRGPEEASLISPPTSACEPPQGARGLRLGLNTKPGEIYSSI